MFLEKNLRSAADTYAEQLAATIVTDPLMQLVIKNAISTGFVAGAAWGLKEFRKEIQETHIAYQ